jgi:CBS domain-containing protein
MNCESWEQYETAKPVQRIMDAYVPRAGPDMPVRTVARLMRDHSVGALPVVEDGRLVGIVTDRDLVCRLLADGPDLPATVASLMSAEPITCTEDQSIAEAAAIMGDHQVRRLPVLDRDGRLVGMVAIDDVACNASERLAGEALGEVVEKR